MERPQSPLVVFGPDHIDTTRAEMLVQCLNDKIKEKRFKLQKIIRNNEEKKKRNESMKTEKLQLTTKLTNIEQENSVREQQLQSEQSRIKELQLNIQMLNDHNNSIKRDSTNEQQKYEQEKLILINKFERTKQQWTEIFKPQYEQSKVYQYLKQSDVAYNSLVQRKDSLVNTQKLANKDYLIRRQEFCNEKNLQLSIISIAKYFLSRRDQINKIEQMKEKLIELENKQKQLIESKIDKMKAWESVYTQPVKRDLMDFCLQTNIDQALTFSFNQMRQDIWSQPMTPTIVLTPQNEQIELVSEEYNQLKPTVTFQSPISTIHDGSAYQNNISSSPPPYSTASTITIIPKTTKNMSVESSRSSIPSILHLTTAIDDDDDDELFSVSRRKLPLAEMEQMTINDIPSSTQAFVVPKSTTNSNNDIDQELLYISQNDQPLTQAFNTISAPTPISIESTLIHDLTTPTSTAKTLQSVDTTSNHVQPTTAFQLAPTPVHNRPVVSNASSIQPQVTSNDVQQMLLTFSSDPSSTHEQQNQQPQPMEHDSEQVQQQQQQQQVAFSMPSSIESITSTEDGYAGFNYNFGFNATATGEMMSPVNFGNWANLGSPITTDSNDQFSAFLQQTNNGDHDVDTGFSFASFNYTGNGGETSSDGAFGSFFFGNGGSSINKEQTNDGKSN